MFWPPTSACPAGRTLCAPPACPAPWKNYAPALTWTPSWTATPPPRNRLAPPPRNRLAPPATACLVTPGSPGAPGTPASPSAPSEPGGPVPVPPIASRVVLTVPLDTGLGHAGTPGTVAGFGPVDGPLARDLLTSAAAHPASRFCLTVTGPDGQAIGHSCLPGPHPWQKLTTRGLTI